MLNVEHSKVQSKKTHTDTGLSIDYFDRGAATVGNVMALVHLKPKLG